MQTQSPPDRETLSLLSNVIVSSPFVHMTHPPPLFVQWLLGKLRKIFPNANLSSLVQDKVRIVAFIMLYIGVKHRQVLSRDRKVGEDALKDP